MTIIAYAPSPVLDQFWIACSKEEAERWFVPLLDERELNQYHDVLRMNAERREYNPEQYVKYCEMIKETMEVNEVAYAYFCVSRDLSECYADVAHHPFHQLWNGYSPFCRCDHVEIDSPDQLKDIVMTLDGKPFEISDFKEA